MYTRTLILFLLFIIASNFCFGDDSDFLKSAVRSTVENLGKAPEFGKAVKSTEACNLNHQVVTKSSWIIPVNISLGNNLKFSANDIKEAVIEAVTCWNTALENAGEKTLNVSIDMKKIINLTDETGVNGNIDQPALDDLGNPPKECSQGYKASEYNIVISNKIERSHVKPYWNKNINLNLKKKAIQVGKLSIECNRIFKEELDPLQSLSQSTIDEVEWKKIQIKREIISKKYSVVCDRLAKEQDDLESKMPDLPNGNLVYISPEKSKQELAHTITHELGHAWGGLDDRYKGSPESRQKNKNNLMGLNAECNLEKAQIESIKKYRKTGKQEVFDSK
ncbi:MAG: hypothetical protein HOP07_06505 [Bacteriovoracaceae bacterium]|nr:hypothetical protein [Bacteriovoracaceae bacterium]